MATVQRDETSTGRAPTGDELLVEAFDIASRYLRANLDQLPADDPHRPVVEALVSSPA